MFCSSLFSSKASTRKLIYYFCHNIFPLNIYIYIPLDKNPINRNEIKINFLIDEKIKFDGGFEIRFLNEKSFLERGVFIPKSAFRQMHPNLAFIDSK